MAEKWPDEATRDLLAQRAVQDDHEDPRSAALQALAEKWPDERHAPCSNSGPFRMTTSPRSAAIQALTEKWPDEETRALLAQRAVQDDNESYPPRRDPGVGREVAGRGDPRTCSPSGPSRIRTIRCGVRLFPRWARCTPSLATSCRREYLDGLRPYLDPLQPISRDRIEQAARKTDIRPDDIDAQVASLSAHLGWDVTRGAKPSGQEKSEENVPEMGGKPGS